VTLVKTFKGWSDW